MNPDAIALCALLAVASGGFLWHWRHTRRQLDALQARLEQVDNARRELAAQLTRLKRQAPEEALRVRRETLLPLFELDDHLRRAQAHASSTSDENLSVGLGLVAKELQNTWAKQGLERVGAVGECFDPHRHDALEHRPDPEGADPTLLQVVEVLSHGFALGGVILRPARVAVAAAIRSEHLLTLDLLTNEPHPAVRAPDE
ncbi:MAG: nucleotide exchange factor GrpE [Deltaproteobacteria bacterium CG_4_9_14_3_um_filter_63_12]|nr:MAG: nucleotide exchange factor GrpE [Deltaproteobacteria bacterium CG_4_9_14_3_um_filter_63_12]